MKNKRNFRVNPKGFTLIELLIVIVIIGLLLGFLLPKLTGTREKAEDLGVQVGGTQIVQAIESYYTDNQAYPGSPGVGECLSDTAATGEVYDILMDGYMNEVPKVKGDIDLDTKECTDAYFYMPIEDNGIDGNGYLLVGKVQSPAKANHLISELALLTLDDTLTTAAVKTSLAGVTQAEIDAAAATDLVGVFVNN